MLDNEILDTLTCLECNQGCMTNIEGTLVCTYCGTMINNDVAPLFVRPVRLPELSTLINLNVNDRPEFHVDEGARVHAKEVYEATGYAQRLMDELKPEKGDLILDLGCGRGQISDALAGRGYKVLSVDLVRENLSDVQNHNKIFASIDDLPLKSSSYDSIVCTDVFEHLYPQMQEKVISEIYRVLKPGGRLLISYPGNNLPNLTGVHIINLAIFLIRFVDKRVRYMSWREPPAHINMSYPWKIQKAFRKVGFKGEIRPFSDKFLSLPGKYVKYAMLLNTRFIAMYFIHLMHGVLEKPAD